MKRANALTLFAVTALLVAVPAAMALANPVLGSGPVPIAGVATVDLTTGTSTWSTTMPAPLADVTIYDNSGLPVLGGIGSTDFTSTWGDRVTTTGTGTLDQVAFSVANLAGGPVTDLIVAITLYNGATTAALGTFNVHVAIGGSGLPSGQGGFVNVTGLGFLGILVNTTDVLVTQQIISITGTSSNMGVLLMNGLPTVGTGSPAMYINSSTVGPPGYYQLNGVAEADPGYLIGILEPTPTKAETWGGVKAQYRK